MDKIKIVKHICYINQIDEQQT